MGALVGHPVSALPGENPGEPFGPVQSPGLGLAGLVWAGTLDLRLGTAVDFRLCTDVGLRSCTDVACRFQAQARSPATEQTGVRVSPPFVYGCRPPFVYGCRFRGFRVGEKPLFVEK